MPSRPCAAGCGRNGFLQYPVITRPFQNSAARFGPCCCTPWPRQREVGKRAEVEVKSTFENTLLEATSDLALPRTARCPLAVVLGARATGDRPTRTGSPYSPELRVGSPGLRPRPSSSAT